MGVARPVQGAPSERGGGGGRAGQGRGRGGGGGGAEACLRGACRHIHGYVEGSELVRR